MEEKSCEFEKKIEKILAQDTDKKLLTDITWDILDFGCNMYHTDENGNKRRIEPFSEEWDEIVKQLPENKNQQP